MAVQNSKKEIVNLNDKSFKELQLLFKFVFRKQYLAITVWIASKQVAHDQVLYTASGLPDLPVSLLFSELTWLKVCGDSIIFPGMNILVLKANQTIC